MGGFVVQSAILLPTWDIDWSDVTPTGPAVVLRLTVETVGAAANKLPDSAKPTDAVNTILAIRAMSIHSCRW